MGVCINVNLPEFKTIESVYGDSSQYLINVWQKSNNSDQIPTLKEMKQHLSTIKAVSNKKVSDFAEKLENNFNALGFTRSEMNMNMLNVDIDSQTYQSDKQKAMAQLNNFLYFNNIPSNYVKYIDTNNGVQVQINKSKISSYITKNEFRTINSNKTRKVVDHLMSLFPDVNVEYVDVSDARSIYQSIPESIRGDVPFENIKAFYDPSTNTSYLINQYVTDEIAIEEVLHPFVESLRVDNIDLYNNLLTEIKNNFRSIVETVSDVYTDQLGFTEEDRNMEIFTKGLTKAFKNEFESKPKSALKRAMKAFLEWFKNIIENFYEVLTGLSIKTGAISSNAKLSDIAKLLNTEDITFQLKPAAKLKVRYALNENLQKGIEFARNRISTDEQGKTFESLFGPQIESKEGTTEIFVASYLENGKPLITFNEEKHEYKNIVTGEIYESTSTVINGKSEVIGNKYIERGNELDSMLTDALLGVPLQEILAKPVDSKAELDKNLRDQLFTELYKQFFGSEAIIEEGEIAIPQVVVYDTNAKIAGTIDVLIITKEGTLKVYDLKTSKYSKSERSTSKRKSGPKLGNKELTTRARQGLQVGFYGRALENMGYELANFNELATIHLRISENGKTGAYQGIDDYNPSYMASDIDNVMPPSFSTTRYISNKQKIDDSDPVSSIHETTDDIITFLNKYKSSLISVKKVFEGLRKEIFSSFDNVEDTYTTIQATISIIDDAIASQDPNILNKELEKILDAATLETQKYINYLDDTNNIDDPNYSKYSVKASNYAKGFEGLNSLYRNRSLNQKIRRKIADLTELLNELDGDMGLSEVANKKVGNREFLDSLSVANRAIYNLVKRKVMTTTTQYLTEEETMSILREAMDISRTEYGVGDIDTSPDVLIRVLYKIFQHEKLGGMYDAESIVKELRGLADRLSRLDPGKTGEELFLYFVNKDGTYVTEISEEFEKEKNDLKESLVDEQNNWMTYRETDNENPNQEDIDYNIALWHKRNKQREFYQAEIIEDGEVKPGRNYEYTEEFKTERDKVMFLEEINGKYKWVKRPNVSIKKFNEFYNKYYESQTGEYSNEGFLIIKLNENGQPTGQTERVSRRQFPKRRYKVLRNIDRLKNKRWLQIQNPQNELQEAQKAFYNFYVNTWKRMLDMTEPGIRRKFEGRIPVKENNLYKEVEKMSDGVKSIWTKLLNIPNLMVDGPQTAIIQRSLPFDNFGNMTDSPPLFYLSENQNQAVIDQLNKDLTVVEQQYRDKEITRDEFKKQRGIILGKLKAETGKVGKEKLSYDVASSLASFIQIAHYYDRMKAAGSVFQAFQKVAAQRAHQPYTFGTQWGKRDGKEFEIRGRTDYESFVEKKIQAFLEMVVYDNEYVEKSVIQNAADSLLRISSLSYLGLNVRGSFNNYLFGRISNYIEAIGGRFLNARSYTRAEKEYNMHFMNSVIYRLSNVNFGKRGAYTEDDPVDKFEALVAHFMMMDSNQDLRQVSRASDNKYIQKFYKGMYFLNDSAEFNVQTKIGMAVLMDAKAINPDTGEELSVYDAYMFDNQTRQLKLKDGYTKIIIQDKFTDKKRIYDVVQDGKLDTKAYKKMIIDTRMKIRAINKQIHGNYAKDDRMVIERTALGRLLAQFHKWVYPGFKTRFTRKYYDENLGWMEGRYRSFVKFVGWFFQNLGNSRDILLDTKGEFIKSAQLKDGAIDPEKQAQQLRYRESQYYAARTTLTELAFAGILWFTLNLLRGGDDEDDLDDFTVISPEMLNESSDFQKKSFNFLTYQTDRLLTEVNTFNPLFGYKDQVRMIESPMASLGFLKDLGDALTMGILTFGALAIYDEEEISENKLFVYQRGIRKGQYKAKKEFYDIVPILKTIKFWENLANIKNYHIGN